MQGLAYGTVLTDGFEDADDTHDVTRRRGPEVALVGRLYTTGSPDALSSGVVGAMPTPG